MKLMRNILGILGSLALLWAAPAMAQSTAAPVVTGYLSSVGCPYGQTTCFVQYGSGGSGGGTVTGNQSNAGAGTTGSTNLGVNGYNYIWNGSSWVQWTGSTTQATASNLNAQVVGDSAAGATDSASNPIKVGGVYLSALPTLLTTQRGNLQLNVNGQLETVISNGNIMAAISAAGSSDGRTTSSSALIVGSYESVFNGTTWDRTYSIQGATAGTGLGVSAVAETPHSTNGTGGSACTSVCSNLVLKASSGNLYSGNLTSGASAGYVMIFNATSAPADGTVTPAYCSVLSANSTWNMANTPIPALFSTGITIVFSTTGCFTKTASATAFISGQFQ